MTVRVLGIGRKTGGDDGAGPEVIRFLRNSPLPTNVEVHEIAEPSALIPLLDDAERVIIVDAALDAGQPGTVHVVRPEDIDGCPISSLSTHGMSVGQAIGLARILSPENVCPEIYLVAIAARKPQGVVFGLSPEVAGAIEPAAALVRGLVETQREH